MAAHRLVDGNSPDSRLMATQQAVELVSGLKRALVSRQNGVAVRVNEPLSRFLRPPVVLVTEDESLRSGHLPDGLKH